MLIIMALLVYKNTYYVFCDYQIVGGIISLVTFIFEKFQIYTKLDRMSIMGPNIQ